MVWQMLDQLQSCQESKEAARAEAQDAQQEHDLPRSGVVGAVAVEGNCLIEARHWGPKFSYPRFDMDQ